MSRRAPSPPPKPSSSTARTVVLVAVVAAIAALILSRGFGGKSTKSTTGASTGVTTAKNTGKTTTTLPGETIPTTVPATLPPVPPASLKVVVLNGNGIQGTAGKRKDELVKLGYALTLAKDAIKKDFAETGVYYTSAEFKDAANAIAAKMGLTAAPAPAETAYVDPANIAGMNVIVVLGKDKAQTQIVATAAGAPAAAATTVPLTAAPKATTTIKKG